MTMRVVGDLSILGALALITGCTVNTTSSEANGGAATGGHASSVGASTGGLASSGGAGTGGLASSGGAGTGGLASSGGAGSSVGGSGTTAGGNSTTGTCNMPSCVTDLMNTCLPSGTCVAQMDLATFQSNTCFSNGVKVGMQVDATTLAITMTFKNGAATCYSIADAVDSAGNEVLTIKNGSGAVVATGTSDASGTTNTMTCTGGQPVTLDSACASPASGTDTTTCTDGTCTL